MWSVRDAVAERARSRAPVMSFAGGATIVIPSRNVAPDVGRLGIPLEAAALRDLQLLPAIIAREDVLITLLEHLRGDGGASSLQFLLGGPDVLEVHRPAADPRLAALW